MQGFEFQVENKRIGIDAKDRFIEQMTKIKGVQTVTIEKPPPPVLLSIGVQCRQNEITTNTFVF